ncbi:MAG: hypothetical protein GDA40_00110 [Rhodobacteraceae bacterium]|nr:hypothetical protein [Paracoccaceae bacterium]
MRSRIDTITARAKGKATQIYAELLRSIDWKPPAHAVIKDAYSSYEAKYGSNPSINGRIFEYLICETLAQEGITPFYYQARFAQVPNAAFDVVLYHPRRPVVLSVKVSLRERYKQDVSEGKALRQAYPLAECYLVTLHHQEAARVSQKIASGDVAGLKKCLCADKSDYTELLEDLKQQRYEETRAIVSTHGVCFGCPPMGAIGEGNG